MSDLVERFTTQIIGTSGIGEAERAIELAGGRLLTRLTLTEAPGELGQYSGRAVVLIEAMNASEAELAHALPRIDAIASALDLPVIAAICEHQIDAYAAAGLIGRRVQLLCDPTMADRIAALAVAAPSLAETHFGEAVNEGEAERLARLNAEVARIADLLAQLSREEPNVPSLADTATRRARSFSGAAPEDDGGVRAQDVRQVIRARRLRDQFFGIGLFEDPAWDMMLDLYAAHLEGERVSVSSLCIAAAVAPTTALRWIGKLTDAGLFQRHPDPDDRRRAFMALSPHALAAIRSYLAVCREQELVLA